MTGGLKYGPEVIEGHKQLAPLKDATDMADCADAYVMIAKNGIQASPQISDQQAV